jgi:protein O-GlcNAc transferase
LWRQILQQAALDELIFADQLSEPQSFGYNLGRLFWGNPITSGHIDTADYFYSADVMETASGQFHYTEQLVRPDGQGIWYKPIPLPPQHMLYDRSRFGLNASSVVYACLQSNFKLHASFDGVLRDILLSVNNSVLMMVEDRRVSWTESLKNRLYGVLGSGLWDRVLWYPRAPNSDMFLSMLSVADVVLHPFPFDGSKTSADAIALGVPYVTWPSVSVCVVAVLCMCSCSWSSDWIGLVYAVLMC